MCGIDVGKASASVCVRVPPADGGKRRSSEVREVPATMNAVMELEESLVAKGIEKVTLESTGDYWRIWFYLLEAAGLSVQLVNARDVKNVPGRPKTDKLDSVWLAKLTERGMLRPSFVPPPAIRELRGYTRMRADLVHDRTPYWQRLESLLEDALIKISPVASSLTPCRDRLQRAPSRGPIGCRGEVRPNVCRPPRYWGSVRDRRTPSCDDAADPRRLAPNGTQACPAICGTLDRPLHDDARPNGGSEASKRNRPADNRIRRTLGFLH